MDTIKTEEKTLFYAITDKLLWKNFPKSTINIDSGRLTWTEFYLKDYSCLVEDFLGETTWFSWGISRYQQNINGGGGTVENDLPFYCHQGEEGHKNTRKL